MALSYATISYNLADMAGEELDARRTRVWVTTNVEGDTIVDTIGNAIRLGDGTGSLAEDGTGYINVWVPGTGSNPASWQTTVHVDYVPRRQSVRQLRSFGPFTITTSANLADLIEEQEVPPTYLSEVTAILEGYVEEAAAARTAARDAAAEAADISAISTSDGVVSALVEGAGGAGPLTRAALGAEISGRQSNLDFGMTGAETDLAAGDIFPCGSINGVGYGSKTTTGGLWSTTDGVTWTLANAAAGAVYGIHDAGDGEVLVNLGSVIARSSGWDTNTLTATWSTVVTANGTSAFILSDVATFENVAICAEYAVPRTDARYLKVSVDYGATWTTRRDLNTMYPSDVAETHWHAVAIDGYHDGANPRLWASHGDGPRGVIYSDNLGVSWTDYDVNTWQPMPLAPTANGIVTSTDQNPDGVWLIPRDLSAKQLLTNIPAPYWSGSLLGFGNASITDPVTGIVYILFRADQQTYFTEDRPAIIFATDGVRANSIYETEFRGHVGVEGSVSWIGVPAILANGTLLAAYTDADGDRHMVSGKAGRGTNAASQRDAGNLLTGSTVHRSSVAIGPNSEAGAQSVVIGSLASNVDLAADSNVVAVGEEAQAGNNSVAVGFQASSGDAGSALGYQADAGSEGLAIGYQATVAASSTGIGTSVTASGAGSLAIGRGVTVSGAGALGVGGQFLQATGQDAVAIGTAFATAYATLAIAGAQATATEAIGIGSGAVASGTYGVALGKDSSAAGQDNIAIGRGATAGSGIQNAVAIGTGSVATSYYGVAFGDRCIELKERSGFGPPPANTAYLWVEDNGSGKTRMMAMFASGAAQQIAIQP